MRHVGELEKLHWGSRQHTTGPGRDTWQREKNHHGSRRFLDMTRLLEQIKLKPSALADQCEKWSA